MKYFSLLFFALPVCGQNCFPPVSLSPNGTQSGELTLESCQLSDSTRISDYRLVAPVRGTLQLSAKGTGFTPSILVRDADGRKVESGVSVNRYVEAGVYRVLLNGSGLGKFTLTSAFQPEADVLCTGLPLLGQGQSAAGNLSAKSCKLPDGTAFDGWQTTIYAAGSLTITMRADTFDSFLILRDEDGTLLATDDNGGGGRDAQIVVPVSGRATYTILAGAVSNESAGGAYRISTSFTPDADETCRPLRLLTETTQVNGSVSVGSCNFNLPGRQDSSLFNVYPIRVAESGTVQISVPMSTFTPLLLLLDQHGNTIVEDSESGGLYNPNLRQALAPGTYNVLIFNEDSFEGDYTLQYTFTPGASRQCPIQALAVDRPVTGMLTADASCRQRELLGDIYKISLSSSATVEIGLASGDFTTFLELRDAKDNLLAFGDSTGEASSAHFQADLPAGTYFLLAASVDLPGSYSLNAHVAPKTIPPCTSIQNLPVNTGFVGVLGQGKCIGQAGEPVDMYRFTVTTDGTAALVMVSGDIDSHLTLIDSAGKIVRIDDNSYGQADAVIVHALKAGTYKVEARSRSGLGRYRLDLLWSARIKPAFCTAAQTQIGEEKDFVLNYTGCQYYDNTFSNIFRFAVSDPERPVTITLRSAAFDSYLILTDLKGNVIAVDDNSAGGFDALVSAILEPGTYFIVVKPTNDASQSGQYRLSVQQ